LTVNDLDPLFPNDDEFRNCCVHEEHKEEAHEQSWKRERQLPKGSELHEWKRHLQPNYNRRPDHARHEQNVHDETAPEYLAPLSPYLRHGRPSRRMPSCFHSMCERNPQHPRSPKDKQHREGKAKPQSWQATAQPSDAPNHYDQCDTDALRGERRVDRWQNRPTGKLIDISLALAALSNVEKLRKGTAQPPRTLAR
jgi:hypothetical protein